MPPLPILYRDDTLAAVDKPSGMLVHRTALSRERRCVLQSLRDQIRRHFAHVFHPLVGDTAYGEGRHNRLFRKRSGLHRLMLAAVGLQLRHPVTRSSLAISAPPAPEFAGLIEAMGWAGIPLPAPGPPHRRRERIAAGRRLRRSQTCKMTGAPERLKRRRDRALVHSSQKSGVPGHRKRSASLKQYRYGAFGPGASGVRLPLDRPAPLVHNFLACF